MPAPVEELDAASSGEQAVADEAGPHPERHASSAEEDAGQQLQPQDACVSAQRW